MTQMCELEAKDLRSQASLPKVKITNSTLHSRIVQEVDLLTHGWQTTMIPSWISGPEKYRRNSS